MKISDKIANEMLILKHKIVCILLKYSLLAATMKFTIDDKHVIKWMWMKKDVEKRLFEDVFGRSLDGVKTLIKISVRDL